jgi:diguanylate cyclase (GGDEF)-like protein
VDTVPWLVAMVLLAVVVLIGEIDFRRVLLLISQTQTRNTRTILDRVITDNFAGVVVADQAGLVRAASRTAITLLDRGDLVGRAASDVLPAELGSAVLAALAQVSTGAAPVGVRREIGVPDADGRMRYLEYVVTRSVLAGGVSVEGRSVDDELIACLTFLDVTERRQAAERTERLARFDTLTGLANRNEFMDRLGDALRSDEADVAVVCIDLDRFKTVNDTVGHNVGDLLLKATAERLKALAGPEDVVARFGGDYYAVAVVRANASTRAVSFAKALLARAGEPFQLGVHRVVTGLSCGIALADGSADSHTLLKWADIALHRAKEGGGNRAIVFEPAMVAGIETQLALQVAMWQALERREFCVFYQPQVDLIDGSITGAEALLRWNHPQLGSVPTSEVIAVAEAVGLIGPLGEFVLRTACADAAMWPEPVRVAVNVSSIQLARGDFAEIVMNALEESALAPDRLELELTETLLVSEADDTLRQIEALSALGVKFALDDFGTGFSALGYITRFPIGKIKLDRSFVSGIPLDTKAVAIVQAVGLLASALGISVNAEGIDSLEQVPMLRLLGCKEGQGFLYSKAVPEPAMRAMLQRGVPLTAVG